MLTNTAAWAAQTVVGSVDYIMQRMRFLPYVDSRVVADGVTEKFSIPASGGTHSPADTVVDLPAPTDKRAGTLELNPTTRLASETVELPDAQMSQVVGGAARSLPLLLTGQLDAVASQLDQFVYTNARDHAGTYTQLTNFPAVPTVSAFAVKNDNLASLRRLYTAFQRMHVDPEMVDLQMVVSDNDFMELLGYPNIIQAQVRGDTDASRMGRVMGVLGINQIRGSSRIAAINRGGTGNRLVNQAGGYQAGYRGPINVDGGSGTQFEAGDVLRFGTSGEETYIVESATADTITPTRQLSSAIADNTAVQPLAGNRESVGLVFSRRSIAHATRMLPVGNDGTIIRVRAQDPSNSLSLRLTVEQRAWGVRAAYDLTHDLIVLQPSEIVQFGSA